MSTKSYQVQDVARLAKVTVRTLHHYDSIGLLVPSGRTEAGYRLYREREERGLLDGTPLTVTRFSITEPCE